MHLEIKAPADIEIKALILSRECKKARLNRATHYRYCKRCFHGFWDMRPSAKSCLVLAAITEAGIKDLELGHTSSVRSTV